MINKYMQYTVYQIKNNINGKIYIGCHKTDDINDGYMGSGKILLRAYKKYGEENFTKELLHVFDTSEEMFEKEIELVNESFVEHQNTYNIKKGGCGGFDYINDKQLNNSANNNSKGGIATARIIATNPDVKAKNIKNAYKGILLRVERCKATGDFSSFATFKDKKHTKEAKAKIGAANAVLQKGKKNSQYGTCWIHNNRVSKKINKNDLNEYLTEGWIKGRKIKF